MFLHDQIISVAYLGIPGANASVSRADAHEVDLSIIFQMTKFFVEITWEREGLAEGIGIVQSVKPMNRGDTLPEAAFEFRPWREIVGRPITSVGYGWHVSQVGLHAVWSIRLEFGGGKSIAIALGEIEEGLNILYHPDTLVAIFDEELAKAYVIRDGITSAWGEDLEN